MVTDRKIFFVYYYFEMNVLRCCPFVHLLDTIFQNSSYDHVLSTNVCLIHDFK